jgi:hypothetical protein
MLGWIYGDARPHMHDIDWRVGVGVRTIRSSVMNAIDLEVRKIRNGP